MRRVEAGSDTSRKWRGIFINDGNGGSNYTVSLVTASGSIAPVPLTSSFT